AIGGDAGVDQGVARGFGAVLAEGEVVFVRAALVAIAADDDLVIRMAVEVGRILGEGGLRVGADVGRVVVVEDVMDVGLELFFLAHGGAGDGDGGLLLHGDTGGGVGGTAFAASDEVIAGRCGGRDGLDAGCGHVADAVNGDAGRVGGLPTEDDLIAGRDAGGRGGELGGGRGGGGGRRLFHGGQRLRLLLATGNCNQGHEKQNRYGNAGKMFQGAI